MGMNLDFETCDRKSCGEREGNGRYSQMCVIVHVVRILPKPDVSGTQHQCSGTPTTIARNGEVYNNLPLYRSCSIRGQVLWLLTLATLRNASSVVEPITYDYMMLMWGRQNPHGKAFASKTYRGIGRSSGLSSDDYAKFTWLGSDERL